VRGVKMRCVMHFNNKTVVGLHKAVAGGTGKLAFCIKARTKRRN